MPKCYSIKLQSLISISEKCYKALAFDGSEAFIPKSQVYGQDWDRSKSESYWISEWILDRVSIQHSRKKWTIFSKDGRNIGQIEFTHHVPKKLNKNTIQHDASLIRSKQK